MDQQQHHSQIMKETSCHLSWKGFTQQGERKMKGEKIKAELPSQQSSGL